MKIIWTTALAAMATVAASVANAGETSTHWFITTPSGSGNSDATGAVVLILLVGAVLLFNNASTTRNTQQLDTDQDANNDDTIMKF